MNDHEKYGGHTLENTFISSYLNYLSTEIEAYGEFMMVKKAKNPEIILQFASMWNMDGLVMIGFCHQDYMYLRNHMRIPFVVYDGYCEHPECMANITLDNFEGGCQVGRFIVSRESILNVIRRFLQYLGKQNRYGIRKNFYLNL